MTMIASEVAAYLEAHPAFFNEHSELLVSLRLPSPIHTDNTVPLVERQVLALRDKTLQLGAKMSQLIRFGEHNDRIIARLHALAVDLIRVERPEEAIRTSLDMLRRDFDLTHAGLKLWGAHTTTLTDWHTQDDRLRLIARNLSVPYTGPFAPEHLIQWFPAQPVLQSFAQVALRRDNGEAFGLLVLASDENYRFTADMETDYLKHLGALLEAALLRTLPVG